MRRLPTIVLFLALSCLVGVADSAVLAQAPDVPPPPIEGRSADDLRERAERAHAEYGRSRREAVDLDALIVELAGLADELEAAGEDSLCVVMLNDEQELHVRAGRFEESRARIGRALELAPRAGLRREEAALRANLAITYALGGDFEGMIEATSEVIPIAQELGDDQLEQRCWFNICVAYTKLGRTPEAMAAIRRSLSIARRLGRASSLSSNYSMATELRMQVNQYEMARVYADSAVSFGREANAALPLSAALLGRAATSFALGDAESALPDADEAVRIRHDSGLEVYLPLAYLTRARIQLALGRYEDCIEAMEDLLPLAEQHGDPTQTMEARVISATARLALGQVEEAEADLVALRDEYEGLLDDLREEASAAGLYRIGGEAYAGLAEVHARRGDLARAWSFLEQGSGALMRSRLMGGREPVELADLHAILRSRRALLLHFSDSIQVPLMMFAVSGDRIERHQLGQGSDVARLAQEALALVEAGDEEMLALTALQRLSEIVLAPLTESLGSGEFDRVLVVAPSELAGFPFEALPLPAGATKSESADRNPTLLGERFAVSYVPCASLLRHWGPRGSEVGAPVLAMADPSLSRSNERVPEGIPSALRDLQGTPLPHARDEISVLRGSSVRSLLGEAASKQQLFAVLGERPSPAVLHFATHALVSATAPENSCLLLAGEDGLLRSGEVEELSLEADLVTLSACQTNGGFAYMGEGAFSLSRSFLLAGARSVVSSLWDVEDEATAGFMQAFYGELGDGVAPDEALRRARVGLAADGAALRDRVGFVLSGSGMEPVDALVGVVTVPSEGWFTGWKGPVLLVLVFGSLLALGSSRSRRARAND